MDGVPEHELWGPDINGVLDRIKSELPTKEQLQPQLERKLIYKRQEGMKSEKISKWSRSKLFCVENNRLFSFPTNFETVNYLNLEENAIKYRSDLLDNIYLQAAENVTPLVDHFAEDLIKFYLENDQLLSPKEAVTMTLQKFPSNTRNEYELTTLMSLLQQWNLGKYMNLVERFLRLSTRQGVDDGVDIYRKYLGVLIASCPSSVDIPHVMGRIGHHALEQYRDCFMTTYEHVYFRCHISLTAGLEYELFENHVPRQDVIFNAFLSGDTKMMRIGLELEWKSFYFCPITSRRQANRGSRRPRNGEVYVEPSLWPRRKDPVHPINYKSFHSLEFYASFSHLIVWTIVRTAFDRRFIELFRLLWRAIPTPHLPIEDMRGGVDFVKVMRAFLPDSINRPIAEPRVYALLAEAFDEDLSADFKPRTLQHLSRYAVRRRIRSPEQISTLNIPIAIKQYLLLSS